MINEGPKLRTKEKISLEITLTNSTFHIILRSTDQRPNIRIDRRLCGVVIFQ